MCQESFWCEDEKCSPAGLRGQGDLRGAEGTGAGLGVGLTQGPAGGSSGRTEAHTKPLREDLPGRQLRWDDQGQAEGVRPETQRRWTRAQTMCPLEVRTCPSAWRGHSWGASGQRPEQGTHLKERSGSIHWVWWEGTQVSKGRHYWSSLPLAEAQWPIPRKPKTAVLCGPWAASQGSAKTIYPACIKYINPTALLIPLCQCPTETIHKS